MHAPTPQESDFGSFFQPDAGSWVLIGIAAALGLASVLVFRITRLVAEKRQSGGSIGPGDVLLLIGQCVEGLAYPAAGAYAASAAGRIVADALPVGVVAIGLAVLAAIGLFFLIMGAVRGDADAGWKVFGVIAMLLYCGALALVAGLAFGDWGSSSPSSSAATALRWVIAIAGTLDAILVTMFGSFLPVLGLVLVALNASWGFLGNLLGLMHHGASWFCFKDHGGIRVDNRRFYTAYDNGFRLKPTFAFTAAAVMTPQPVEKHESVHVLQHFIAGPIFKLTYGGWFALFVLPGLVFGLIAEAASSNANKNVGGAGVEAAEAWAYYNNPYEVMAYAIEGGRAVNGSTRFVWGTALSWILSIVWWLIGIGGFLLLVLL